MHAADRNFVDKGHESILFPSVYQKSLARSAHGRWEMPEQGGPREPGAADDQARTAARTAAGAHFRGHTREFPFLHLSLHPSSSGSIALGVSVLGESLYKTRRRT